MIVYSKTNHIKLLRKICRVICWSSSNVNISVRTVSATVTWWKCKAAVVSHSRCQFKPTDRKKTVQNKSSRKVFVDLQKVLYQKAHKHRLNNNLSTRAKLSLHIPALIFHSPSVINANSMLIRQDIFKLTHYLSLY